jgi:chemotaxis protein methyltransferase CheR
MASQLFNFDFSKKRAETSSSKPSIGTTTSTSSYTPSDKMEMTTTVFNNFRSLIYKLCGIYFTDSKKYLLEGRIVRRLTANKMRTFEEYYKFIDSSAGRMELNELFEAITINETYFFRAPQQFEALENSIVPEVIPSKKGAGLQTFKIWVAASSTGEEAYTIAIIILEKFKLKYPHIQFQVFASDINNAVIEQAKQGIYKEYAIRNVPKNLLAKYFKFDGVNYRLNDEVKRLVKFANINLYDTQQMKAMRGMDVIFCCNVLIYFDIPSKQQVVSYLYDSLNKGGYLFIGYSESLHGLSKAFKLVHLPKSMAYKKE